MGYGGNVQTLITNSYFPRVIHGHIISLVLEVFESPPATVLFCVGGHHVHLRDGDLQRGFLGGRAAVGLGVLGQNAGGEGGGG